MPLAEQLEATWSARFVADHPWSFPSLEIAHLMGLTVVFGGMVLLDLRLLGLAAHTAHYAAATPHTALCTGGFAYFYAFKF